LIGLEEYVVTVIAHMSTKSVHFVFECIIAYVILTADTLLVPILVRA